jgi:iron complex outermembrane receptor protein
MFPERVVSLNARLEKNSLGELNSDSDEYGSRVSAFFLDQFLDRRLGIALGYARLDSPGQAQKWEAWGYPSDVAGAGGAYTLGGGKVQSSSTDNVRQGLMGVLEYQANDHYSTTVDVYYSKFDKTETTRFLETGLGWSGAHLTNPTVVDGVTVAGTYVGVRPVLRNDLNEGDDKLFAIGWNNQFKFNDDWRATLDLSHSKADRHESILETYSGTRAGVVDNVDFVLDLYGGFPQFNFSRDYTDPTAIVLTDPGGWGQDGYIKTPSIDDELNSFRADVERSFASGPFKSVEFGFNYADREKSRSVPESLLDLIADPSALPTDLIIDPVDLGHAGVPGTLSYRINRVFPTYYNFRPQVHPDVTNKQWTVEEKITTGYVQLNVQTDLGSVPMRGNIGLQAQHADQSSDGFIVVQGDAAAAQPYNGGNKYTDFLPSLNLSFEFPYQIVGRVGLGRQLARPRIDQMRANNNTGLTLTGEHQGEWTRSGGNPDLKPWIANAFDVSVEKYWENHGYVSLAYFYKDLQTYVYDQATGFDATIFPIPSGYTGRTPDAVGTYTRPANGTGGNIHGFEAAVSIPFEQFAEFLTGFGVQANFSDTSSSIKRLGPDGPSEPIAGLSKQVRNITLYYENYGFSARVSRRSRSDFLGEIQGFGADRTPVFIDGDAVVDAQLGYSFQEGDTLEGFSLLFQVNNATNEPYRQYFKAPDCTIACGATQRYEKYGRQYLFGVTYRF